MDKKQKINDFLVRVFNSILRQEEKALSAHADGKLSVSEYHAIEAVYNATKIGANTMSDISKQLNITLGSLTVAVTTLEKKGYLIRKKEDKDKRTVRILCTEMGEEANCFHREFHNKMVEEIMAVLDDEKQEIIIDALAVLEEYFCKKGVKN